MSILVSRASKQIHLKPFMLHDAKGNIVSIIRSQIGTYVSTYGYIKDIVDITISSTGSISRWSEDVLFDAEYTIHHVIPRVGDVYECLINNIIPQGIFCSFEKIFILLPVKDDWEYSEKRKSMTIGDTIFTEGGKVDARITTVKFENMYKCIGVLA